MRYAGHSHVAVAPGLAGRPLHRFVHVLNRLRVDVSEDAAGLVRSGDVDDEERITAANVEIEVARFHEAASVGEADWHQFHRLRRLGVGVNRKQGGKFSRRVRPENIRVERHSFANRECATSRSILIPYFRGEVCHFVENTFHPPSRFHCTRRTWRVSFGISSAGVRCRAN